MKKIKIDSSDELPVAVLSDEYESDVKLSTVIACPILKNKEAAKIVKWLTVHHPLPQLAHLKRIRATKEDNGNKLDVVICYQPEDEFFCKLTKERLVTNDSIAEALGEPFLAEVSTFVPLTRKQFEISSKFWPVSFHEDKWVASLLQDHIFESEELKRHKSFMCLAAEQAMKNYMNSKNGIPVGCVIVDPNDNNKVVASSEDTSSNHPLHHAVLNCINLVAEQQLLTYTGKSKTGPYLCTNYDAYVTVEPCSMCAMALLHSRIGRVFYWKSHQDGALGSHYKIHTTKGFNHKFLVFKNLTPSKCYEELQNLALHSSPT